ncbi:MAG TPA: bifunctional riboflavin kinase/FAD synthetase [Solirubrobacteraceae bacterium]|nr:bifunctional riboflavin kinase/FAD synthetase [Solirubrobacteraceae bacterium]
MKLSWLNEVQRRPRRVAVGEFDGVHLGHREVIGGADTVLTFEPHPRTVIAPEAAPKLLTPLTVKQDLIAALGVEELVLIPFDKSFARQSAQEFVDGVLVDALAASHVSVGENFRFGHRASGDVAMLTAQTGFATRVVPLVEAGGEIVSSSHIRGLLLGGAVGQAADFLGRPYEMRGSVVHGDHRGRDLGYPTANIVPDDRLVCPGHGVYACRANGMPAAVNVGVRPTFATGRGVLVEAYLIDWEGDLYDQEVRVEFLRRLRGERAFNSVDALIEQMATDVEQARLVVADWLD